MMGRRLLVNLAALTAAQRAALTAAAESQGFEAVFRDDAASARSAAGDAEIIFSIDAGLIECAPALKWFCTPFAGVDQYIRPALLDREGVLLSGSTGAYGVTISEHVVMVTLDMMRGMDKYQALVRRRGWRRDLPVRSIKGCRALLLGTGDIGRETAKRLRAFGPASIIGVNRSGHAQPGIFDAVYPIAGLDRLLPGADLLVMSLPGTPLTEKLMDARRLSLLSADAYIVNVGRGAAIDTAALLELMRRGHLAGAALDVFPEEPLPPESPLWDCPRLLITPHVAGNMTLPYTVQRVTELFLEDFQRYCEGQPLLRGIAVDRGY